MANDTVEVYFNNKMLCRVASSMPPPIKGLISIKGIVYEVLRITYAVDTAGAYDVKMMRCNIDVERLS